MNLDCTDTGERTFVEVEDSDYYWEKIFIVGLIVVFLLPIILFTQWYKVFITNFKGYAYGFIGYVLLLPGFINVLKIYSMVNLHDFEWHTIKSADKSKKE